MRVCVGSVRGGVIALVMGQQLEVHLGRCGCFGADSFGINMSIFFVINPLLFMLQLFRDVR